MTPENYCETCQTLAVVCPDESHPKTYTKQSPDTHTNDLVLEPRCEICEARGCSIASHTKTEIELKALCRQTITSSFHDLDYNEEDNNKEADGTTDPEDYRYVYSWERKT